MKDIEKILMKRKKAVDQVQVPDELEVRLRSALEKANLKKRRKINWKTKAAAAFIAILILGYNSDTLAFYGKKLMGYDQIMNGSLKQLNELGKGQIIDKSFTFENGVAVTLDGIMLDENQLLVFYTVKDPRKNVDKVDMYSDISIEGLFKSYSINSAVGKMNEEKTEMSYIARFPSPLFFEKKLSLEFALMENRKLEEGKITFKIDRNKAMGHTLKKNINKTIEVDETDIIFESILASPTVTTIKGKIQNIIELAKDEIKGERFRPNSFNVEILANGKKISEQGSSLSTDLNGITFEFQFDALPHSLKELQIKVVSFGADHDVRETIKLDKDSDKLSINILGQNIKINKVYESKGDTYVTITSEESVILTRVYLMMDGEKVELKETVMGSHDKLSDGTILHTRTLRFPGTGEELKLDIQRMTYEKVYNKTISIPIH